MDETAWLNGTDPTPMLEFLRGKASDRKLRLFSVACYRRAFPTIKDKAICNMLRVADEVADGVAPEEGRVAACNGLASLLRLPANDPLQMAAVVAAHLGARQGEASTRVSTHAVNMARTRYAHDPASMTIAMNMERRNQVSLLRNIIGNPFRPSPPPPPAVLAWNDGTVRRIAEAIYEDRKLPEGMLDDGRLAILADALLDAGCEDEALMEHCRSEGPHVRGCFAIDLLLGKS